MASGDTLCSFEPKSNDPPATVFALIDIRNSIPILAFDDSTLWTAIFPGLMPRNYGGNGLTVTLYWMAASATSGNVVWTAAFERDNANNHDLDSDNFAATQTATGAANGTSGKLTATAITFSNSQIDGIVGGDPFRMQVNRDAAAGGDTMTGNAQLFRIEIKET